MHNQVFRVEKQVMHLKTQENTCGLSCGLAHPQDLHTSTLSRKPQRL
jgi:hypothetical protein